MGPDYRVEETEWIQARSAAFDAGYRMRILVDAALQSAALGAPVHFESTHAVEGA